MFGENPWRLFRRADLTSRQDRSWFVSLFEPAFSLTRHLRHGMRPMPFPTKNPDCGSLSADSGLTSDRQPREDDRRAFEE